MWTNHLNVRCTVNVKIFTSNNASKAFLSWPKQYSTFSISNNCTLFLLKSTGSFSNELWFDINHVSSMSLGFDGGDFCWSQTLSHSKARQHKPPDTLKNLLDLLSSLKVNLTFSLCLYFSFCLLPLPLFHCLYHCTIWRIYTLFVSNKSVPSYSCPEWCLRAKITK